MTGIRTSMVMEKKVCQRLVDQASSLRWGLIWHSQLIGLKKRIRLGTSSSWDSRSVISVRSTESSTVDTMICCECRFYCSVRHESTNISVERYLTSGSPHGTRQDNLDNGPHMLSVRWLLSRCRLFTPFHPYNLLFKSSLVVIESVDGFLFIIVDKTRVRGNTQINGSVLIVELFVTLVTEVSCHNQSYLYIPWTLFKWIPEKVLYSVL